MANTEPTTGVLYGPSDVHNFTFGDHRHTFTAEKTRHPFSSFGDDNRSLPILTCDACREHARKHLGFAPDPTKVALTTDEQEYMERFQREGSMETQVMMREAGRAMAEFVNQSKGRT